MELYVEAFHKALVENLDAVEKAAKEIASV